MAVEQSIERLYLVLLGPPGSGKGTQAAELQEFLHLPHISSGDLFREHIEQETDIGLQARECIARGELVPDALTIAMMTNRLQKPDCGGGAILDGFPRTLPQAQAFDQMLSDWGQRVTLVPCIVVPDEVLVARLTGRWVCRICGESYQVRFKPPRQPGICDLDAGELYQRPDDQPETVRTRLQVYRTQTSPLIDYYHNRGVLVEINGDQTVDAVQEDLRAAVLKRTGGRPTPGGSGT